MIVRVAFPIPLAGPFSYLVPESLIERARPGCRVSAPLGRRKQVGFIVGLDDGPPPPSIRLKEIEEVLDAGPVFSGPFLAFIARVAGDFLSSPGELLMNSLPPGSKDKPKPLYVLTQAGREASPSELGPLGKKAAAVLAGAPRGYTARYISRELEGKDVSALLSRLKARGFVEVVEKAAPVRRKKRGDVPAGAGPGDQLDLAFGPGRSVGDLKAVENAIEAERFGSFYLYGSRSRLDKAYLELLASVPAGEGTALVLAPEAEKAERLKALLDAVPGSEAVLFHGRMTPREKEDAWGLISSGRARTIVGARSALFLPFEGLRLIIVDGEEDDSHFQAESPSYDARRAALARAGEEGLPVVFGSSCPTVEAFTGFRRAGSLIRLEDGGGPAAEAAVIGSPAGNGRLIAPDLAAAVRDELKNGRKTVVFFNRRGFASSLACPSCGHVVRCGRCGIPMVLHRRKDGVKLVCHYCNRMESPPAACPGCRGRLDAGRGPGIQAVEEELKSLFPGKNVARFDADSAGTPGRRERILADFARGRTDILVGTRLLAGRTPLADVGLAVIMGPERVLETADYRASWNAFRDVFTLFEPFRRLPGVRLAVQTTLPVHYSIQAGAAGDYDGFYRREIEYRRLLNYPPFAGLAEVGIFGRDLRVLAARSRDFAAAAKAGGTGMEVLGPVLLPSGRVPGLSGVQFVLKAKERKTIAGFLERALPSLQARKTVAFSHSLDEG